MTVIYTKKSEDQDFEEVIIKPDNDDFDSTYENGGLTWQKIEFHMKIIFLFQVLKYPWTKRPMVRVGLVLVLISITATILVPIIVIAKRSFQKAVGNCFENTVW